MLADIVGVYHFERLGYLTVEQGATRSQQVAVSHFAHTVVTEVEPVIGFAQDATAHELFQHIRHLRLRQTRGVPKHRHIEIPANYSGHVGQAARLVAEVGKASRRERAHLIGKLERAIRTGRSPIPHGPGPLHNDEGIAFTKRPHTIGEHCRRRLLARRQKRPEELHRLVTG